MQSKTRQEKKRLGWIIGLSLLILTFVFIQVDSKEFQPRGMYGGIGDLVTGQEIDSPEPDPMTSPTPHTTLESSTTINPITSTTTITTSPEDDDDSTSTRCACSCSPYEVGTSCTAENELQIFDGSPPCEAYEYDGCTTSSREVYNSMTDSMVTIPGTSGEYRFCTDDFPSIICVNVHDRECVEEQLRSTPAAAGLQLKPLATVPPEHTASPAFVNPGFFLLTEGQEVELKTEGLRACTALAGRDKDSAAHILAHIQEVNIYESSFEDILSELYSTYGAMEIEIYFGPYTQTPNKAKIECLVRKHGHEVIGITTFSPTDCNVIKVFGEGPISTVTPGGTACNMHGAHDFCCDETMI